MLQSIIGIRLLIVLFILLLVFLELGRRVRLFLFAKEHVSNKSSLSGPVETVIFALLGLLLTFTFTGAASRFETRRQLIAVETNAIGTAYLRIDLMPKEAQPQMRSLFKQYTLNRANVYKDVNNEALTKSLVNSYQNLQKQIWDISVTNCTKAGVPNYCALLMLPALNDMFDITTTRYVALQNHPPNTIYILLILLSLFSAFLVGYNSPGSNKRNLFYFLSYAIIISLILYIIIDLELPRYGFITIHGADQVILDLGNSM